MTFDANEAEKMAEKLCTEKALGESHLPKDCPITKALQQAYDLGAKEENKAIVKLVDTYPIFDPGVVSVAIRSRMNRMKTDRLTTKGE